MNEKMRFGCKKRMDTVILNFKQVSLTLPILLLTQYVLNQFEPGRQTWSDNFKFKSLDRLILGKYVMRHYLAW